MISLGPSGLEQTSIDEVELPPKARYERKLISGEKAA
jgi:hypothetical protein